MTGLHNYICMRAGKSRAKLLQKVYFAVDFYLLLLAESIPPTLKVVGVLYVPCHRRNITQKECHVNLGLVRRVSAG